MKFIKFKISNKIKRLFTKTTIKSELTSRPLTVSLNSLNVGIELTTEREPVYKIKNILSDQVNDKNDLDENESDNDPNGTVNSNNSQNGLYLHQNSSS